MPRAIRKIVYPIERFLAEESAGGFLLLLTALTALVWANSNYYESYFAFIESSLSFQWGEFVLEKSFQHWINDGLMVIFFFVVGLEIKKELLIGELSTTKKAALPIWAALGGMIVPVIFYLVFNYQTPTAQGWGIPMATDIAFALGILTLFSRQAPFALKILLLALAIVDDLGAVLVIALFYTQHIYFTFLCLSLLLVGIFYFFLVSGVRNYILYGVLSVLLWFFVLKSGIHTTLAGVVLGLLTPLRPQYSFKFFQNKIKSIWEDLSQGESKEPEKKINFYQFKKEISGSFSPLEYFIHLLHPWVSFLIMPLFALTNAGVRLENWDTASVFTHPVSIGIILGLFLGKPLGVVGLSFLAVKLKWAELPQGVHWNHIMALGALAGVGFTMALFISHLALEGSEAEIFSKIGILVGSFFSSCLGVLLLCLNKKPYFQKSS